MADDVSFCCFRLRVPDPDQQYLFAPLIAFLFWESNKDVFQEKRFTVFRDAVFCLAAFLIVFLIQFLVNLRDFSSPFIWPYALHDTASQGFQLKLF